MAVHGYVSHDDLSGATPWDRIAAAGYTGFGDEENIAAGYTTAASVMSAWMSDYGHCANIMSVQGSTEIGIGWAQGGSYGTYQTQDFGLR
jgi:uncharacterized protein YkwD